MSKLPQTESIRFFYNGIRHNGAKKLIKCYYFVGENSLTIRAVSGLDGLPADIFTVENHTDFQSDYFDEDSAVIKCEHPLYKFARAAALKKEIRNLTERAEHKEGMAAAGGRWADNYAREAQECRERLARYQVELATLPAGHPTDADVWAARDFILEKRAAERAAREAQEKAEAAERQRQFDEAREAGSRFIRETAELYPVQVGGVNVRICWSEYPAFYGWEDDELMLSLRAAEIILKRFDERVAEDQEHGYYKTKFRIEWTEPDTGEAGSYEGRYDLGDNDGGLIAHVECFANSYSTYGRSTAEEDREQRKELRSFAEWLRSECYGTGTAEDSAEVVTEQEPKQAVRDIPGDSDGVVKVELASWVVDALEQKRKEEERKREKELAWIEVETSMLTDAELEKAIFMVDPKTDEGKAIGAYFLDKLKERDMDRALEVFKRWINGGAA